ICTFAGSEPEIAESKNSPFPLFQGAASPGNLEKDPVCGMSVDPLRAAATQQHEGRTYFFCCEGCRGKFAAEPARYLVPPTEAASVSGGAPSAQGWVCPMCEEVREERPGPCPSCGRALERESAAPGRVRTEYVCPMHPEIVEDAAGACPISGIALEPTA